MGIMSKREYGQLAVHTLLTALYACRAQKKHVRVEDEACKLGLVVLNALCRTRRVRTCRDGREAILKYERGELCKAPTLKSTERPDFTEFDFELDQEPLAGNVILTQRTDEDSLSALPRGVYSWGWAAGFESKLGRRVDSGR